METAPTGPEPVPAAPVPGSAPPASQPSRDSSPFPAPGTLTPATGAAFAYPLRPLNVKDALSYLDRVKQQFADEHEVYDKFLNIMKDFKTNSIDTPGVIDRVSSLFRGHPSLIQGFNTFLPPGYRIECSVSAPNEEGASNTITVTTPMGITTRTQDVTGVEAREFVKTNPQALAGPAVSSSSSAESSRREPSASTSAADAKPSTSAIPSTRLPSLPPIASLGGTPVREPQQQAEDIPWRLESKKPKPPPRTPLAPVRAEGAPPVEQPTPVMEFNHAINYVNKIKNRFVDDPETYKTFLEILQTYQKETRPIQEVYTQVTALFHSAPDLLDEFKAFLPDTTDSSAPPAPPSKKKPSTASRDLANAKKAALEEKKKRAAPGMGERAKAKRAKTNHAIAAESPPILSPAKADRNQQSEPQQQQASSYHNTQPYGAAPVGFPGAPRMQSAYDSYLSNHRAPALVQSEEFGFFDRVKKYLDDRATYTEFLKLLNLFTQEIIDVATLLEKSLLFIGGSDDLVGAFKDLVGWDAVKDGRIEGEDWIIDNEPVLERPKVELHLMKSFGPSYRKLPDSEIDLACSGRDSLEWSVLNDEWVAFATSASEGSGAHRKNVYEDALYNSEQERHWYSFQIESNLRTIAHFEPIAARIVRMDAVERLHFRMEEGLGGSSPSIYKRVIKKVYGKDQGNEILQAIYDNPCVAVPIVLARLKQKDEEWKRALREWNKVWREVDAKNFYRALDHQGVNFKALDKKATMTTKSLTGEIELLRREKEQSRIDVDLAVATVRPRHQYELGLPDRDILFDVLKLTCSFLDRDQGGFSIPERARVEGFIRLFVPLLFGVTHEEMEANLPHSDELANAALEEDDRDMDSEAEATSDAESTNGHDSSDGGRRGTVNKKGGAADLRRRLLTHAAATAGRGSLHKSSSRATSPVDSLASGTGAGDQTWIQLDESFASDGEDGAVRRFNFFANSSFYCLVRLIHTLYHRLSDFKALTVELAAKESTQRLSVMAVELGLTTPVAVIDHGPNPASQFYEHALDLAEKLFDAEIDQPTYEEHLRYMVGINAYPLYTVDKLISTIIKHIHTINGDSKCHELVALLERDRARESTTPRQQIAYRMEAEELIGTDDSLYRVEYLPETKALTIQLLSKDDLTLDDAYGSEARLHHSWRCSYALSAATEGVSTPSHGPLLNRNRVLSANEDPQDFDSTTGLQVTVKEGSYELLFVPNTEDYLHRRRVDEAVEPAAGTEAPIPIGEKRQRRFDDWLEGAASRNQATTSGGRYATRLEGAP